MIKAVRDQLHQLILNPLFMAAIFSWISAQFVKTFIKLFSGKITSLKELVEFSLWRTGGMPSSHSALVTSLCTGIAYRSGMQSDIFILACCFALVVIRDAVGVRRSSGIQAKTLNEIGQALDEQGVLKFKPVKEVQGHRPIEVFVGCLLGFFIGTAFSVL